MDEKKQMLLDFALKVEKWLLMEDMPYIVWDTIFNDWREMYVEWSEKLGVAPDSELLNRLKATAKELEH